LAEDVGERRNLASEYPEVVNELQKLHEEWALSVPEY
jgi:hypothetical protein